MSVNQSGSVMVIGGGAAGFFAAIHHKETHPDDDVVIVDKSKQVLAKVKISGGGRCNVTQACFDPHLLVQGYPRGNREMLGPFHRFGPQDTMKWFESRGVPLKIEADNRVFPVSNQSQSIMDCLMGEAQRLGVKVWTGCSVQQIQKKEQHFVLQLGNGNSHPCDKLVLATGSNRQGYGFAKQLGHRIIDPIPSLFTFSISELEMCALSGLSVEKARVWLEGDKKGDQMGPVLITHWGLSGPAVIRLSAWQAKRLFELNYQANVCVDWLPTIDVEGVLRQQTSQKQIGSQSPFSEIPFRLWQYLVRDFKDRVWSQLGDKQMQGLVHRLTQAVYSMTGKGPFKEEFVTCGGVDLKEVNFKTMESKICPGLYIVGELLNVDGITGGYNFQNAWTTGYSAGTAK